MIQASFRQALVAIAVFIGLAAASHAFATVEIIRPRAHTEGQTLVLRAQVFGMSSNREYRWQRNVPIIDGVQPDGVIITGSTTDTLTLINWGWPHANDLFRITVRDLNSGQTNTATAQVNIEHVVLSNCTEFVLSSQDQSLPRVFIADAAMQEWIVSNFLTGTRGNRYFQIRMSFWPELGAWVNPFTSQPITFDAWAPGEPTTSLASIVVMNRLFATQGIGTIGQWSDEPVGSPVNAYFGMRQPVIIRRNTTDCATPGAGFAFCVSAERGTEPLTYSWLARDGRVLTEGPQPDGSTITGVNTNRIVVSNPTLGTGFPLRAIATDPLGCFDATLICMEIPRDDGCASIDFNNDGSIFDPDDLDDFLFVFAESPCPIRIEPTTGESCECNSVDTNRDGSIYDPADIDRFLSMLSEGPCFP